MDALFSVYVIEVFCGLVKPLETDIKYSFGLRQASCEIVVNFSVNLLSCHCV